jgi:tetratricopeptide (TPR) repeat protein
MAKAKRVTRKQLLKEPDEFITFSGRLIQFGMAHKNHLVYAAAGLVLIVAILTGVRFLGNRSEDKASLALGNVLKSYSEIASQKDVNLIYTTVADGFKAVIDNYSSRSAGKLARLLFADLCYKAARYDEAIVLYEKSLKDYSDQPWVKDLALNGLAYSLEAKGDFAAAVKYYQMIAADSESILKAQALMNLGRTQAAAGEKEKSLATFKQLIDQHPDAMYIKLAREYVGQKS